MKQWADKAVGKRTSAKYTFNAFVAAIRGQLQLEFEKKLRGTNIVSATIYQRYRRTMQSNKTKNMEAKTQLKETEKECRITGVVETITSRETVKASPQKNMLVVNSRMKSLPFMRSKELLIEWKIHTVVRKKMERVTMNRDMRTKR